MALHRVFGEIVTQLSAALYLLVGYYPYSTKETTITSSVIDKSECVMTLCSDRDVGFEEVLQ